MDLKKSDIYSYNKYFVWEGKAFKQKMGLNFLQNFLFTLL